jgi:hypothetical protein
MRLTNVVNSHKPVEIAMLKINDVEITAKNFAWDGCHKIYLINSDKERSEAESSGYTLFPINELPEVFDVSCGLRFINNWDLTGHVVRQFEDADFKGFSTEPVNAE